MARAASGVNATSAASWRSSSAATSSARSSRRSASVGRRKSNPARRACRSRRKAPLSHHGIEILMRRCHEARVDRHRIGAPQRQHLAFLQDPQEDGLRAGRKVADLVEKQCPFVGRANEPDSILRRSRKRAAPITEQLTLHQIHREAAAVHRHEAARSTGQLVHGAGDAIPSRFRFPRGAARTPGWKRCARAAGNPRPEELHTVVKLG